MKIEDLVSSVKELAAAYPNAVYLKENGVCRYCYGFVSNGPDRQGCIIGQALLKCGVSEYKLKQLDRDHPGVTIRDLIEEGLIDIEVTDNWTSCLSEVQFGQDMGKSWSESVRSIQ